MVGEPDCTCGHRLSLHAPADGGPCVGFGRDLTNRPDYPVPDDEPCACEGFERPVKAQVYLKVETEDHRDDEAWWLVTEEDSRADAIEAAEEVVELLQKHHWFPARIEDSKP